MKRTESDEEFRGLWEGTLPHLRVQVLALMPQRRDADDVLQEVAATAWEKFDQYRPGSNFRAWASQIVRNKVMNHTSRLRRSRCVFDSPLVELLAADIVERADVLERQSELLHECLSELRASDRFIVVRRYQSGATVRDVANEIGKSADAVYKSLTRIRRTLLDCVSRKAD